MYIHNNYYGFIPSLNFKVLVWGSVTFVKVHSYCLDYDHALRSLGFGSGVVTLRACINNLQQQGEGNYRVKERGGGRREGEKPFWGNPRFS